jgi:hypothetical protein
MKNLKNIFVFTFHACALLGLAYLSVIAASLLTPEMAVLFFCMEIFIILHAFVKNFYIVAFRSKKALSFYKNYKHVLNFIETLGFIAENTCLILVMVQLMGTGYLSIYIGFSFLSALALQIGIYHFDSNNMLSLSLDFLLDHLLDVNYYISLVCMMLPLLFVEGAGAIIFPIFSLIGSAMYFSLLDLDLLLVTSEFVKLANNYLDAFDGKIINAKNIEIIKGREKYVRAYLIRLSKVVPHEVTQQIYNTVNSKFPDNPIIPADMKVV